MSRDTHRNWLYELFGRHIHLWQYSETGNISKVGDYNVKLPDDYYGDQLIYPNEDITNGLRVEYTALSDLFVKEALEDTSTRTSGTDIRFPSTSTCVKNSAGMTFADSAPFDKIRIIGSANNDGDYQLTDASAGTLTDSTAPWSTALVGESITIYQIPVTDSSPSETSHVNLNRILSLAVVDFLKAMRAEQSGNIELKAYYIKEFWKKIGDNESNKRKYSMSFPVSPFAIK